MNGAKYGWIDACVDACMDRWIDRWGQKVWMDARMNKWREGGSGVWVGGWRRKRWMTDGWTDGWTDE